jgi:hypothetical protein
VESPGKLGDKGFEIDFESVVRVWKRIQNPPRQQHQNFIAQVVGWEKPEPKARANHKESAITIVHYMQCHLDVGTTLGG